MRSHVKNAHTVQKARAKTYIGGVERLDTRVVCSFNLLDAFFLP